MTGTVEFFGIPQDAIERIISTVCKADPRLAAKASEIDRFKFALDISVCRPIFESLTKIGSHATAKKRLKSLDQIKKYSTRAHDLLKAALSDDWLRNEVCINLSLPGWQPSTPIADIPAIAGQGEVLLGELLANLNALGRARPFYPVFSPIGLSGFEAFAGAHLPNLFHQHFGRAATRRRDPYGSAAIEGGVIAFASAVMRELHITKRDGSAYADETISRAMTLARQKNRRRMAK